MSEKKLEINQAKSTKSSVLQNSSQPNVVCNLLVLFYYLSSALEQRRIGQHPTSTAAALSNKQQSTMERYSATVSQITETSPFHHTQAGHRVKNQVGLKTEDGATKGHCLSSLF